jgi:1-acyl-sn-glycerol-3-phosphate acyltransferase
MATVAKIFQAITYWPIYLFLKFFLRYEVEGQENLRGLENKSVIFASNHASYIDGPISAAAMPRGSFYPHKFFPIRFLVLREFFNWKNRFSFPVSVLMISYVHINGSIPVDKARGDLYKALKDAVEVLNNNARVWIYPEGGMTKDGKLRQGKRGVASLHQQTGAPIVPVGIIGNFGILSAKTLLRKNKVRVKIGKPIYSLGEISLEEGAEKVMTEIARLIDKI